MLYLHDFDLVELVQAVEPPHIFAIRAGLPTEACRISGVANRELRLVEYHVAIEIGDGYFGGRYEIEVVFVAMVHLALLVGELSGAITRSGIDHIGGLHFEITGFAGAVEEEADEGSLQAGTFTFINGESGSGDFHAQFKVDEVVFAGQFPVGQSIGRQIGHDSARTLHDVVFGRASLGHHITGRIGDREEYVGNIRFGRCHGLFEFLVRLLHFGHFGFHGFGFGGVSLFHEFTDLRRKGFQFGEALVQLHL